MEKKNIRDIKIEKVTLHCSSAEPAKLEKYMKLLKLVSGMQPVKTVARKRIPAFKIRPGLHIGYKVTVRGNKALELLNRLFAGVVSLSRKQFSDGYLSFGIKEYIEIPSIPYQRDIGIIGFDVVVNLIRAGRRVANRKLKKASVGRNQKISKEETIEFMKNKFNLNIE